MASEKKEKKEKINEIGDDKGESLSLSLDYEKRNSKWFAVEKNHIKKEHKKAIDLKRESEKKKVFLLFSFTYS